MGAVVSRLIFVLVVSLLAIAAMVPTAASAARSAEDRYIVVLKEGADPAAVAKAHGSPKAKIFRTALNGYAGKISASDLAAVKRDSRVAYVEADRLMRAQATQTGATWGLDRIDQRLLPLNSTFSYARTGAGVTAYIIDTGLRPTHADFGGRAVANQDFVDPANPNGPYYNNGKDCNGHGTHVAGTVGGASYGVAKSVSLVGVRVLDCDGYGLISEIVAGVDWVTRNAAKPAVANMSLGGGGSTALDSAVSRSIAAGITYAVAAGNEHRDACTFSPARVGAAITVAASDRTDRRPHFSNYGNCVDWFSPGVGITSDWFTSDTSAATLDGTSMASPHTAGAAAHYLEANPAAAPATVRSALYTQATKARVSNSRTTNNHLLYTGD
jgi:subtilisin family serine protease